MKRIALLLSVVALGCATPAPTPLAPVPSRLEAQSAQLSTGELRTVRAYRTLQHGERVDTLRITAQETMVVVHSVRVESLRAGDLLVAHGDLEATNDCGYNVALVTFMLLAASDAVAAPANEGMIALPAGFNITANMHHGLASRSGSYIITRDTPVAYVNLVAYAQSDVRTCRGLRVERGYGQLVVLHHSR